MSRASTSFSVEMRKISIFCSYAHQDEKHREQLERHLGFLIRTKDLNVWSDRKISHGDEWESQIDERLNAADIILLLISPDFAASQYCWDVETKRALERRERGEALVVPIILRPVAGWKETPIGRLQALPKDAYPVTKWRNQDDAYQNIAQGLRKLIDEGLGETTYVEPEWFYWSLKLDGQPESYSKRRVSTIAAKLRETAKSEKLEYLKSSPASVQLSFRSTPFVYDTLKALHAEGKLQQLFDDSVLDLGPEPGAVLRVESRIVDKEYRSTIHYLPEIFGGRSLEEGFPPLVGGITFPLKDPMQIGFSLLADASLPTPTSEEQVELQTRLGRYLNTFLVLSGDQVNVTLTPMDDYCGLPELLRQTDLGRDMLAQDVVLKHHAASQLHPSTTHGKAFWDEVDAIADGPQTFETCFRVWIVPDNASVLEKSEDGRGHVTIEKLGLKVLCEADYDTLRRFRERRGERTLFPDKLGNDEQIVDLFKRIIVPKIQREVSAGPRFGLLRQILSVQVIAKWIMESQLGGALQQAGFLGSNAPEKFSLNTVDENVLTSMKQLYLQLFGDGIWQHTRTRYNLETKDVEKRLYVAGGIDPRNGSKPLRSCLPEQPAIRSSQPARMRR